MIFSRLPILNLLHLFAPTSSTYFYPTVQTSLLEHILVDTQGAHASDFIAAITPCTNYVNGAQTLGRITSAQWIRVAFHDFVTANITAGTGGLDASIGFETLRGENSGAAMNDSMGFFRPRVSSKIATADFIALSVVMSVGNCGGPQIPLRGGRVDATEGGATGVPAPDSSLADTLGFFGGAGFNQVDSIGLTACGHTMGNVHHEGFPIVVGPDAVSENNTGGGIHFDSTVATFDTLVVHEYLNGTGNAGGPLVTSFNVSSRSDLRLYESDNNATMTSLANQGNGFFDTCVNLFQRMLDTVPTGVVLSDVIEPMPLKPINATLDFDNDGNLIFTGYIRTLATGTSAAPQSLNLTTSLDKQGLLLTPESETGSSIFGSTTFFPFSTQISNPEAFTSFNVSAPGISSQSFPVQSGAFVVPSLTTVTTIHNTTATVAFSVATRQGYVGRMMKRDNSTAPSVSIQAPVAQVGTLGPRIETFDDVAVTSVAQKAGYYVWEGSVTVEDWTLGPLSISVLNENGDEVDVAMVD
ncbi:WSC domain-containing protein [Lachnellula hyalina]|uniref:Peroxidase n=1 Tax=Lachnellula hyalina TaxID=1316788 RepID=A0A8H8R876_9HELO|nr:WSC domain-containing protein [Lachnellula hyalina]TVY30360.1 WSC domain-containing protein [Lachnellula hyalina]